MAERIQNSCTMNKANVYAMFVTLEDVIAEALQNGEIVRLDDLCTLLTVRALTEENFNTSVIKKKPISSRQSRVLANAMSSLTLTKVEIKYPKEEVEKEGEEEGVSK